jgi:hypothetical protein
MKGWRGFLGAVFGLSVLYAVLQPGAPERVGGAFEGISGLMEKGFARIGNPNIAGLRDFRTGPLKPAAYTFRPAGGANPPKEPVRPPQSGRMRPL